MRGPRARDDLRAALGGAAAALPLTLFLAVDTGASPIRALVALGIGGVVAALLSGTRVAAGGPSIAAGAALTALAASHDGETIAVACLAAGVLQLLLGVFGAGRLADLLPLGMTQGYVAGIGAAFLLQAIPHALGVATPVALSPLELLDHIGASVRHASLPGLVIASIVALGTGISMRLSPRVPTALVLIVLAAITSAAAGLEVPRLGDVLELPPAGMPRLPRHGIAAALGLSLSLGMLSSLETLLSASAQRERDKERRADAGQDLIAAGIASILLAFAGGLPASTSIARGEVHRDGDPPTRLSAVLVAVLAFVFGLVLLALGPWLPVAAISGASIAVAMRLLDPRPLVAVFRASRREAAAAIVTTLVIALLGLEAGLQAGLGVSLLVAAVSVARARHVLHPGQGSAAHQITLSGPLTFLASPMLADLGRRLELLDPSLGVIFDVRGVSFVDATGATRLVELAHRIKARGGTLALLGISPQSKAAIVQADSRHELEGRFAVNEKELDALLGKAGSFQPRAQLLAGLERFREDVRHHYTPLFDQLADGQSPHTLLVTCVDSRIQPELLTGTHPGELFIVRCLGALVSPLGEGNLPAEAAAVEYAVGVLGVRNVIVCGHSQCGAIKALKKHSAPPELEALNKWMAKADAASGDLHDFDDVDAAGRAAIARQLDNLRSIPQVREREKNGELRLSAWFYDVAKADVLEWNEERREYAVPGADPRKSLTPSKPPPPGATSA